MVSILPLYVTLDKNTFTSLNTPILIPVSFHSYVYGATNRPLKYTDSPMRIQTAFKLILICQYAGYNSDYEALKLKLNTIKQSHWAPHSFGVHVISNRVYAPFVTTKKKTIQFRCHGSLYLNYAWVSRCWIDSCEKSCICEHLLVILRGVEPYSLKIATNTN